MVKFDKNVKNFNRENFLRAVQSVSKKKESIEKALGRLYSQKVSDGKFILNFKGELPPDLLFFLQEGVKGLNDLIERGIFGISNRGKLYLKHTIKKKE